LVVAAAATDIASVRDGVVVAGTQIASTRNAATAAATATQSFFMHLIMPSMREFRREGQSENARQTISTIFSLLGKPFGTGANNSPCKNHLCNKLKHHAKSCLAGSLARIAHLVVRWTPSETGATQATLAATQARLYGAKLPRRKRAGHGQG
jgi:hypothetical protein